MLMDKGLKYTDLYTGPYQQDPPPPIGTTMATKQPGCSERVSFYIDSITQPNVFKITFLCPAHLKISPSIRNWFKKVYPPKSPSRWGIRMTVGGNHLEGRCPRSSHRCLLPLRSVPCSSPLGCSLRKPRPLASGVCTGH